MTHPRLAVGILSYNGRAFLPACLDSVLAQAPAPAETVVFDNASTDGSADLVAARYPGVHLIRSPENLGVARGLNALVAATTAPLVILLNQDVELRPGCLAALADTFDTPEVGVVGAKLLYPDGRTVQHAGGWLEWPLFLAQHYGYGEPDDGRWDTPRPVEFVTGAVFAVRRVVWDTLGGMSDLFSPAYFEETDFCLRAQGHGWQVLYQPTAVAIHHESTTLGRGSPTYLRLYHRHRLRLILRFASIDHLLTHFARAEARRVAGLRHVVGGQGAADEVSALAAAYADAETMWPSLKQDRGDAPVSPGASWAVTELFAALRRLAETSADLEDWKRVPLPSMALVPARDAVLEAQAALTGLAEDTPQRLSERLAAVAAAQTVREQPFTSNAPLVGPLIVRVRAAWNWMSTQWYVRPLLDQQNRFNTEVAAALDELAAVSTRRSEMRERVVDSLKALIAALEEQHTAQDALRLDHDALVTREDHHFADLTARLAASARADDAPTTTDDRPLTIDD